MKIITNKNTLKKIVIKEKKIGFVPTMGAIHPGHISLIKKSSQNCSKTIVSIFVNKPQFNKKNDYKKYPRNLKQDISLLKKTNVDILFLPSFKQIYPNGQNKNIKIDSFKNKLCGKTRPGHFKAVVDVIDRFIKIINPYKIFFGKKDFQQLKLIESFVNKTHKNIKVIGCKTIREKNGVAYSSRNLLLNKNEFSIASKIYRFLYKNKKKIINNYISINFAKNKMYQIGVNKIDYLEVVDINKTTRPFKKNKLYKLFVSYYLGNTRLIDNI